MTYHFPDLGKASDWSCCVGYLLQPIRGTTQIWFVTRHQYRLSALVSQTSLRGETNGGVVKCRLFSQATPASLWHKEACDHHSSLIGLREVRLCLGRVNANSFPAIIDVKMNWKLTSFGLCMHHFALFALWIYATEGFVVWDVYVVLRRL